MPIDPISATPIADAASLWALLNGKGGLAPNSHDASLLVSLRRALAAPAGSDIGQFLARQQVDASSFLIALLTSLEPFGLMLSETFAMFERHGVEGSNDGLLVQFDFGLAEGKLAFDANHFRRAMASLQALHQAVAVRLLHKDDLWAFREVLRGFLPDDEPLFDGLPETPAARRWLARAVARPRGWPYDEPPPLPPPDPSNELLQAMQVLLHAIRQACARLSRYANEDELRQAAYRSEPIEPGQDERAGPLQWAERTFGFAQLDLPAWLLLSLCWRVYERHAEPSPLRAALARQLEAAIAEHSATAICPDPRQQLEDLLELPWWQQRHQLYSVWLVTVVEAAVPPPLRFRLHPVDGRLTFAFKATRVADIDGAALPIALTAELYADRNGVPLQGKGREHGIQPDYVLEQAGAPDPVIYVLEAKQYRKPSRSNFSAALHDYAAVHRSAVVALANYGPMTADLAASIRGLMAISRVGAADELIQRCRPFGHIEPTHRDDVALLSADMRSCLQDLPRAMHALIVIDASGSMAEQLPGHLDDAEVAALWAAMIPPGAQVIAVNQERSEAFGEAHGAAALIAGLRRVIRADVGLRDALPPGQPHPAALLVTDAQGFEETRTQHAKYLAILVLRGDKRPRLHALPARADDIEQAFPGLAARCAPA